MLEERQDDVQNDNEDVTEKDSNAAWAEVMANILGKKGPKDAKSLILAKNKEKDEMDLALEKEKKEQQKKMVKKRKWEEMGRVKPDPLQKDYEKNLEKTATKGVVQLFNAVRKHQKNLDEQITNAKTESKKDKVIESISKGEFLDMIAGNKGTKKSKLPEQNKKSEYKESKKDKSWSILQDDFMMGNDLKNWDKESDEEKSDE